MWRLFSVVIHELLYVGQGLGGLRLGFRQTQQHGAECFAVDVTGIGTQNVDDDAAVDGQ